jgi:hypothetical protein
MEQSLSAKLQFIVGDIGYAFNNDIGIFYDFIGKMYIETCFRLRSEVFLLHFIPIVVSFYSNCGFILSLFLFHLITIVFHFIPIVVSFYPYCGFILSLLWFHFILIVVSFITIVVSF